ncbi:MAG: growth inhibitor [Armatimonadetes bacterium CG_4_10_14_3_um_filter_66_18]|nr:type II toxin-antitoxin system PemK/MazF family toxin [Armatimonadota bacterium]OIP04873.1 MAG: hypothetical protein AUJ96_11850 [Armatimonadetes bacterium CG2_30_66_41]PIU93435.1 MAG: growth inhibitor [Armatimonadetes bacterium CG06_land_8_20_14_3_00_66_21]PIW17756.1 MAG: growth inhibitor [Armatimonadetes bacterium CG17_big_fil_post_rev_8_21_14_2_50_66_6]PIX42422.1 MAG: growth inhibitor [Armatimonadetes bacterium CG_4_8_14_3_um_filter_66_20]PIY44576.1 MAG: growth inhibitor [Armatimonadetes
MTYDFGEIVLIDFPQTTSPLPKRRPALTILDIGDADIVVAPITTRERRGEGDHVLSQRKSAGLLRQSWVRPAKVACLPKADIVRQLGRLPQSCRTLSVVAGGHHVYSLSQPGRAGRP